MRNLIGQVSEVFSGLRFRLLVLLVLACAPLVALMLHTAGDDRRRAMASWQQKSEKLQLIARREEQQAIGATRQLLLAISESASIRSLEPQRCQNWLDELLASYPRYTNLGVIATNGELLASAVIPPEVPGRADRSFFARALASRAFAVGRFPTAAGEGRPTISFGYPVLDPRSGRALAVVFAELDLQSLDQSATELAAQLPKEAIWLEIDRNGIILSKHPRPEGWVGRPFPQSALLETVLSESNGVAEATSQEGEPYFYAFGSMPSRLAGSEVATLLGIPKDILFADADRILFRNLTWLGLAAGVAMALGWVGSQLLILGPVKALVKSSARLASGDLSVRTGLPHTRDELGQLTAAFDQMAQALEQRALEQQRASQKLQVLSRRLVEVQESERRNIARELHDEIGQSLTAAEMHLQAALRSPGTALERRLEESIQAVERVLEQVHDLSLNLRPSMLDDLGLEPALRWYTHRQAELTGMQAEFRADALENRLDPLIETECFRIAQEALTNVVRHAHATAVRVELNHQDGHLHLMVRDNGIGFDVSTLRDEAVRGASLGLLSMEERASLAGGSLDLNSAPGRGTAIHAWFPLRWRPVQPVSDLTELHD